MIRMRGRFSLPSRVRSCQHCDALLTVSTEGGRLTIIHALPWCGAFRELNEAMVAEGAERHELVPVAIDAATGEAQAFIERKA